MACTLALIGCSSSPPAVDSRRQIVAKAAPEPALSEAEIAVASTPATGDLDTMTSRGVIRILVAPGRTDYAITDRQQSGAAFDAGKAFEAFVRSAAELGASHLKVVFIPMPPERLLPALTGGHGDLIAGRFAQTYEREDQVSFSEPVLKDVREVLVTGPGVPPMVSLEDVAGRSIHVRRGSDRFDGLTRLNGQLARIGKPGCAIVAMDASLTEEDLLQMVNDGRVPVTLVDQYLAAAWRPVFDKIAVNPDVSVSQDGVYAWAVRKDSPQLLALVNTFLHTHDLGEYGRR